MGLNEHKNLIDSQLHNCKGFSGALKNQYLIKNERYLQAWETRNFLPPVIDVADPNSPPPTEVDGDTYIVGDQIVHLDVNTITWQSGTTVRYVFNGTPDLSVYSTGDFITFVDSGNANNDGTFAITAIDNGADWIEILNPIRTSSTGDEASDSPCVGSVTDAEWDGAQQNDWVRYNAADDFWYNINAEVSFLCYNVTTGSVLKFNGVTWFGEDTDVKKIVLLVSAAELATLFTSPVNIGIPSPGVGKYIMPVNVVGILNYNTTAYTTLQIWIRYVGGSTPINVFPTTFSQASTKVADNRSNSHPMLEDTEIEIYDPVADDATGDSDVTLHFYYRIISE